MDISKRAGDGGSNSDSKSTTLLVADLSDQGKCSVSIDPLTTILCENEYLLGGKFLDHIHCEIDIQKTADEVVNRFCNVRQRKVS